MKHVTKEGSLLGGKREFSKPKESVVFFLRECREICVSGKRCNRDYGAQVLVVARTDVACGGFEHRQGGYGLKVSFEFQAQS